MACALIKRKALHHFNFSRVIAALVQLLFIAIPDSRLARIAIYHFHQCDRLFHILIQRQKLQDGLQQFFGSVPVRTNHNGIFADAFSREISVCENDFVAMSHLAEDFQKFRTKDRRNVLQHTVSPYLSVGSPFSRRSNLR